MHAYSIDIINQYIYLSPSIGLHQREIEERLKLQKDNRAWMTKKDGKPFPAPLAPLAT